MDFFLRIFMGFVRLDAATMFITIFMPVYVIILFVLYTLVKTERKWIYNLMGTVPMAVFLVFYLFNFTKGNASVAAIRFLPQFLMAGIILIGSFWVKGGGVRKMSKGITAVSVIVLTLWSLLYSLGLSGLTNMGNFSHLGWSDALSETIDSLEQNYVLRSWKEIDFDMLREEYLPRLQKAEEDNDEIAYAEAVTELCYEFHDAHFYLLMNNGELQKEVTDKMAGNDYGFSMIQTDTGEVIAILTEENSEAYNVGIHDGTVITEWNGEAIEQAVSNVKCIQPSIEYPAFPLTENEDKVKAIYLAGKGGETNSISFLDGNKKEKTVEIHSIGSYANRLNEAIDPLTGKWSEENFRTQMLDEQCGYLAITRERYDTYGDIWASLEDDYPQIREIIDQKLCELEDQGMNRLVIDIRGNGGGYEPIAAAVASLFSDKDKNLEWGLYSDTKGFVGLVPEDIRMDGSWNDIPVVVLVNAGCVSSGDHLAYALADCPNVTMMGITASCGSAQTSGGGCILTDSEIEIHYPLFADITLEGSPYIDAGKDRAGQPLLDEEISLDRNAVEDIYINGQDYELKYALEYINHMNNISMRKKERKIYWQR